MGWASEEFNTIDLGEKRLDKRAVLLAERMAAQPVALCLQDTTSLDFNGQAIDGLGQLQYEAQRALLLHPTYVVTPGRETPPPRSTVSH